MITIFLSLFIALAAVDNHFIPPFTFEGRDMEMPVPGEEIKASLEKCRAAVPKHMQKQVQEWMQGGFQDGFVCLKTDGQLSTGAASQLMCGLAETLETKAVGYTSERNGQLIHHFQPKREEKDEQTSESSGVLLECHQEVAYMPNGIRPTFLILYGVQQDYHKECETGIYDMRNLKEYFESNPEEKNLATREEWFVGPDMASLICGGVDDPKPRQHIQLKPFPMMSFDQQGNMSVAFWDVDTGFSDNEKMLEFRKRIEKKVDEEMKWVKIEAGDFVIINNEVAVHARKSFRATFDKNDRHIMRTLCFTPSTMPKGYLDEGKWCVNYTTCTKEGGCICLNSNDPKRAERLRLKPAEAPTENMNCRIL